MLLLCLLVKVPVMTISSPLIIGHLFDAVIICRAYWKKCHIMILPKMNPRVYFLKPPFERLIFVWKEIWAINLMGAFCIWRRGLSPRFFLREFFSCTLLSEHLEQANPARGTFLLLALCCCTQSTHTNKNICSQHYIYCHILISHTVVTKWKICSSCMYKL